MKTAIVWHWTDLRVDWNPALSYSSQEYEKIVPIYIYTPELESLGEASKWWLHHSLISLQKDYKALGSRLILDQGNPLKLLTHLIHQTEADALYFNARFEPNLFQMQEKICKSLEKQGIDCVAFNGNHLIDPREIEVAPGKPYSVFTPFYKACQKHLSLPKKPPMPRKLSTPKKPASKKVNDLKLLPRKRWIEKLERHWTPGRAEGLKHLKHFMKGAEDRYAKDRDIPAIKGTSSLSPYLHFGEICPHEVYLQATREAFKRQLFWREFGSYFLFHFKEAAHKNWNPKFDRFEWDRNPSLLKKWHQGQTGYPVVDAAMRELYETGWMHNRMRMVVASFLIKDLLIDWKKGEKWFWDTLVDADQANNILGWQWTAGSGPDAAPYFRIFNPILQGLKFDPDGDYVRKYVPELKNLPDKWIHRPFEAPEEVLEEAGVTLGKTYPRPIVDHAEARKEALKRFQKIK